jgi:hypothetical protein
MTDTDKLIALLTANAKGTLLVATRLNALERAMQEVYGSVPLWDSYVKHLGWAKNPANLLQARRELRADQELDDAIAELQNLLREQSSEGDEHEV